MKQPGLVFDAYGTLYDVHSVVARCDQFWPGKGAALSQLWRAKQFDHSIARLGDLVELLAQPRTSHLKPRRTMPASGRLRRLVS